MRICLCVQWWESWKAMPGLDELLSDRAVALLLADVLDELFRDRRGALGLAAGEIGEGRAHEAADADAGLAPEAAVLDRHDRVDHVL